jgi:hypothetical protein
MEPERTAGRMGSTQGVMMVARPAMKTSSRDGAAMFFQKLKSDCFYLNVVEI